MPVPAIIDTGVFGVIMVARERTERAEVITRDPESQGARTRSGDVYASLGKYTSRSA
jgi:hypothetical protein